MPEVILSLKVSTYPVKIKIKRSGSICYGRLSGRKSVYIVLDCVASVVVLDVP